MRPTIFPFLITGLSTVINNNFLYFPNLTSFLRVCRVSDLMTVVTTETAYLSFSSETFVAMYYNYCTPGGALSVDTRAVEIRNKLGKYVIST